MLIDGISQQRHDVKNVILTLRACEGVARHSSASTCWFPSAGTHAYMRRGGDKEKGVLIQNESSPVCHLPKYDDMKALSAKSLVWSRTLGALWCCSARLSHSLDNLHRPVHRCGVVIDENGLAKAPLWIQPFERNQLRASHASKHSVSNCQRKCTVSSFEEPRAISAPTSSTCLSKCRTKTMHHIRGQLS